MNRIKTLVLLLVASIIQFTIISRIEIFGVSPNIFLPIIVSLTLGFGAVRGSFIGLAFGLLEDILFSPIIGPKALYYFLIGFIIADNGHRFNVKDYRTGALLTALTSLIMCLISLVISYFTNINLEMTYFIKTTVLFTLYNSILYYPIINLFKKIFVFPDIVFFR